MGFLVGCFGCYFLVRLSFLKLSKVFFCWGNIVFWCFFLWWFYSFVDLFVFLFCYRMNNGDWGFSYLCVFIVIFYCLFKIIIVELRDLVI